MTIQKAPVDIEWPDDFPEDRRAQLRDALVAYNQALRELDSGPAAAFATEGNRNRVFHGFAKRWDELWSEPGPCMHPGCTHRSIARSHSISLAGPLRRIAEAGHVLTPRYSDTRMSLAPVGIRRAATFPGYCPDHEALFWKFEVRKALTEEQHFRLQAFRTVCREVYGKRHQLEKAETMLAAHRRRREAFVIARMHAARHTEEPLDVSGLTFGNDDFEARIVDFIANARPALFELERLYDCLFEELETGADRVAMLVANFDVELSVALSGFGISNSVRNGEPDGAVCFLAIIPEAGNTKIILGTAPEHADALDHHLTDHSSFAVLEMLERWMIHGTDHWFIRPSAWAVIPPHRQKAICDRILEPRSLDDPLPFSVLDEARRHIIALAQAQLVDGSVPVEDRHAVERIIQDETAKLS